jgi:hypothetical protein
MSVPTPAELVELQKQAEEKYYKICQNIAKTFCEKLSEKIIQNPHEHCYTVEVDHSSDFSEGYRRMLPYDQKYVNVIKLYIQYLIMQKGWIPTISNINDGAFVYSITIFLYPLKFDTLSDFNICIVNYEHLCSYVKNLEKPPPKETWISKLKTRFFKLKK